MKRTRINQNMVVDYHVLAKAALKAASGKRNRPDIQRFFENFNDNIARLRKDLLEGVAPYNRFRNFTIFDPKQRVITAVGFEDRVIHHALMEYVGPVLETAMVPFTYACRPGKGPLQAVIQAQADIRKHPWYVKIDIAKYFETIDHQILFECLSQKFKGEFFRSLVQRIIHGYSTVPGKGLPIGSLTSQHFANFYLDGLDRLIMEKSPALAYVRYMDDMVWWAADKITAKKILMRVHDYLQSERQLMIKNTIQIQRSRAGMTFCGFRVMPGSLRLTARKKKRYAERRKYWENLFSEGKISGRRLQKAYDSVRGIVAHTASTSWLTRQLEFHPAPDV